MSYAARIESVTGDTEASDALRVELAESSDPATLDAMWRERPVDATRVWTELMEARRQFSHAHDWPSATRPQFGFKPDFHGDLWMYSSSDASAASSWKVVVHPAPGLTREAEFSLAGDVRWYDQPPADDVPCWFTYDRDCFIEVLVPGRPYPYFLRRTQPSFGRWRVRRSPQPL